MTFYLLPFIGNKILGYRVKKEGGAQTSKALRSFTKENYKIEVGMYSYGGCFSPKFNYNVGGVVNVGKYCSFASDIHYFGANHPLERFSTSPYFFRKEWGFDVEDVERSILSIGNDVWVGYGVLITSGCKHIGNGAVIAAGSVITDDVPAYSVVGGVPGRVLKKRFSEKISDLLEECCWWDLSPAELYSIQEEHSKLDDFARAVIAYKKNTNWSV